MSGIAGQKHFLLWLEQEVWQLYCWVQRRHRADEEIDRKDEDHSYDLTEAER